MNGYKLDVRPLVIDLQKMRKTDDGITVTYFCRRDGCEKEIAEGNDMYCSEHYDIYCAQFDYDNEVDDAETTIQTFEA